MVTGSRQRNCGKCRKELVNENGVHMGIPFGNWTQRLPDDGYVKTLLCAKCYDEITVVDNIQRTGEQVL